jgi:hypothetical protein
MFKTVVWATDGCESAARALRYARALATGEGAMLIAAPPFKRRRPTGLDTAPASDGCAEDRQNKITTSSAGCQAMASTRF